MNGEEDLGFPVFGLKADPFRQSELDPMARPEDLGRVSQVDGWGKLETAHALIRRRVDEAEPVFFVVEGPDFTGRSSVANYLVYLWADAQRDQSGALPKVLVHRRDQGPNTGPFTAGDQLFDWMDRLRTLTLKRRLTLTKATHDYLNALSSTASGSTFATALMAIENDLRIPESGDPCLLAAILERGKGRGLVRLVQDAFAATRAIVVITADLSDEARDLLNELDSTLDASGGGRIPLGMIRGTEVGRVIEDRWANHRPGVDCPFDLDGVANVFDEPRPIARILKVLSRMMGTRQVHSADAAPWPATPELKFNEEDMRSLLRYVDDNIDLRGR